MTEPFRPLTCVHFGKAKGHIHDAEVGMVVMEEPQGSIYRYDYIIPHGSTPKQIADIISIAIMAVQNDYEAGRVRWMEGEESPLVYHG